jgi:hypothetical protein
MKEVSKTVELDSESYWAVETTAGSNTNEK